MTTTSSPPKQNASSALRLAQPQRQRHEQPKHWQDLLIAGWFFLLPWLHFWRLWFGIPRERGYVSWNFFEERWPRFQLAVQSLFSGHWAQWDPFLGGGSPLAAEPSLGLYSPSHWPYLLYYAIFREHHFLVFESLLMWQLALAGCGMYLYLRSLQLDRRAALLGGTLFVIAGVSPLFYGTHLFSAVLWTPWALWALEGFLQRPTLKGATWFALFLSFAQLSGSPTGFLLLLVFSFFYALFRFLWEGVEAPKQTFLWLLYAICLVALWGAIVWIPYLELATMLPPHRTHVHAFPATRLWGLLSPLYGNHLYHGILLLPLVLAAWLGGQHRRLWWVGITLAIWGLLFALWPQLRALDPSPQYLFTSPYITSRPDRYLAIISPAFCVLAALGINALLTPHPRNWQKEFTLLLSILWGLGFLVLLGLSLWSMRNNTFSISQETQVFQQWALCGGMLYCLAHLKKRATWGWTITLVFLLWLDIAPHTRRSGHRSFTEYTERQGDVLATLSPIKQQHQRILNAYDEAPRLASALFRLRALEGAQPPRLTQREKSLFQAIKKYPEILRLFNVSHVITSRSGNNLYHQRFFHNLYALQREYRPIYTHNKATLLESRKPFAARIQWIPRWHVVKRWQDALKQLPRLHPLCEAILESSPHTPPAPQPKAQRFLLPQPRSKRAQRHQPTSFPVLQKRPATRPFPSSRSHFRGLPSTQPHHISSNPTSKRSLPPRKPSPTMAPKMAVRFVLPTCPAKSVAAKILFADARTLIAEIDAPKDGIVLINERYWNGWSATLDQKPVPLLRANILLQAIRVPQGKHTLHLRYRSRIASLGLSLWGLAWLLALAIFAMTTLWGDPAQKRDDL